MQRALRAAALPSRRPPGKPNTAGLDFWSQSQARRRLSYTFGYVIWCFVFSSVVVCFCTAKLDITDKDMITSANGNQYLKPDYLSPMPTSLDAKKSPLALLAQTCSQIGADSPPKQAEKKKETREKASPASASGSPKASFKPYDLDDKRSKTPAKSPRESPPSKDKYPAELLKSPYVYPRMCRDPYCTGCLSGHVLGKPCPSGCTQCGHMAAAYAHAQLAALAAQPYICSWITGDSYCGKRFTSSEELLTHLRSHTGDPVLPHPLLSRSYPTPPLSPLSTARFHPYSKPLLTPSLAPFPYPHPGLPPYFTPYSLYPPRLGASHP